MNYDVLIALIDSIGKDKIVGISYDNSKRTTVRDMYDAQGKPTGQRESFDDRFTIDQTHDCIVVSDLDSGRVPYKTYIPLICVQGIIAVEDAADRNKINMRYTVG